MTDAQERFVKLERQRVAYKEFLQELEEATQQIADEDGIGSLFQDEKGVVYKIIAPAGRWVAFDPIGYVRTKREDEAKGTLSTKEAKEAGFEI